MISDVKEKVFDGFDYHLYRCLNLINMYGGLSGTLTFLAT